MFASAALAIAIAVCPPPPARRHHCVHDGDTVWWQGEKIRIADIDAPEIKGRCRRESRLALQSRDRLAALINAGQGIRIRRQSKDRYGRTLARMMVRDYSSDTRKMVSLGEVLIAEGLASRWPKRRNWCAAP